MLYEGEAMVMDFGIAKAVSAAGSETLTQTGMMVGTPAYVSPGAGRRRDRTSTGEAISTVSRACSTRCSPESGRSPARPRRRSWRSDSPKRRSRFATFAERVPENVERAVTKAMSTEADRTVTRRRRSSRRRSRRQPVDADRYGRRCRSRSVSAAKSVAVLPFANMSADPENEYFADGMAEEIINALSKIQSLRVASRTSSFAFKGKNEDIGEIGRKLKVSTVLEGSVRKMGNRLRITAQLVNVADGYQLWSERYDREMEDVFAIQDEISQAIVKALRVILSEGEKKAIEKSAHRQTSRRTTTTCAAGSSSTSSAARVSSTPGRCSTRRSRSIPITRSRTPASPTAARFSTRTSTRASSISGRPTSRARRRSSSSPSWPRRTCRAGSSLR